LLQVATVCSLYRNEFAEFDDDDDDGIKEEGKEEDDYEDEKEEDSFASIQVPRNKKAKLTVLFHGGRYAQGTGTGCRGGSHHLGPSRDESVRVEELNRAKRR
jgi:hypothetical protein